MVWMDHSVLNCSPIEGHLCCFQSSELIFKNYFNLFFKNKKFSLQSVKEYVETKLIVFLLPPQQSLLTALCLSLHTFLTYKCANKY